MISRLTGTVLEKRPPQLVLETSSGIAYEIELPLNQFQHVPSVGGSFILYTHFIVREDVQSLYGFTLPQSRELFRYLIKITNVGPKLAIGILSSLLPDQFMECVFKKDIDRLKKIPGVGKKTAERLVMEMHDQAIDWIKTNALSLKDTNLVDPVIELSHPRRDAVDALVALGYKRHVAHHAIQQIKQEHAQPEAFIRVALQKIL